MAKSYILTGLDIGSSSIKALIAFKKSNSSDFEILSQVSEPSFGIRRGVVIDIERVSGIIKSVLDKTQKGCGQKIEGVFVNIGGTHIFSTSSHGTVVVSRADQEISQEDIDRVLEAAQTFSLPPNREILDVLPREFIVDGKKEIKQPLSMRGVRLEVETLVLCAFSPYLKNLSQTVLNTGFQIDGWVISPLASSKAVLTSREKELGVILLDIGARTTGLAMFKEGDLIHTVILPIGSGHITDDIGIGLKTDPDTAERIKLEFGSCLLKGMRKKKKVKEEGSGEILVFTQDALGKIIDPRISEILEQARKEIKKSAGQEIFPVGVVLTGGGARLPKIKEFAKKILKLPVRIGVPRSFFPVPEDPALSVVCGLVLQRWESQQEKGSLGLIGTIGSKIKKIFRSFIP